jgi:hypothetical protein
MLLDNIRARRSRRNTIMLLPGGRKSWPGGAPLARDLPGTGSKTKARGAPAETRSCFCPEGVGAGLPAICREPAAKPKHTECPQNLGRLYGCRYAPDRQQASSYALRAESKA